VRAWDNRESGALKRLRLLAPRHRAGIKGLAAERTIGNGPGGAAGHAEGRGTSVASSGSRWSASRRSAQGCGGAGGTLGCRMPRWSMMNRVSGRRARGKRYYAEHREECCAAQRAYDRLRPSAKGNCVMLKLSGSTLLIGQPGAFQLYVADELAFQHARTGATVVYIAETDRAERAVFDRLDAWTLAKKVARDIPIRRLTGARSWQKADDVLEALRLAEIMGSALLVRDLSGEQALHPNSPWLTMARRLMPHTVLTVANWGGTPRPPNLADYDATLVLECRVGQRFGVSLLTGAEVVQEYQQYQGREVQSTVIFDPAAPTAAQPQGHHR
jgi:hypothetical protein